ncbi:MAG: ABC transporter permease [Candidatus Brockarchaeota archaeon]|nr:ABC transporter permease [Candidatus Brockarchaeota archaeon]
MSSDNIHHPSLLRGLWALTFRELKKWLNDPIMLLMFVLQPLIWMGLLGKSMNLRAMFSPENIGNIPIPDKIPVPGDYVTPRIDGYVYVSGAWLSRSIQQMFSSVGENVIRNTFGVSDYFSYMAIGMISMIVMTTTMFSGMSIVWDRRLGFLDKVLSTPVPRGAIIFSKVLNATLRAMLQATIILTLATIFGLQLSSSFTLLNILGIYAAIFLLSVGLSSIFLAFSLRSTRLERPMQIVSLITMPLMFASNTFFPISLMPEWLQSVAYVNPLSYLTDALRQLTILSLNTSCLVTDFLYLSIFAIMFSSIGIILSWKYLTR